MSDPAVLFDEKSTRGNKIVAFVRLNTPRTINALNQVMVDSLTERLDRWAADERVVCVVLDGAGAKGFCAGGDVIRMRQAALDGEDSVRRFYAAEYALDYRLHTYNKPILCWGDGLVMGGGLGLMAGCGHRVVTENTRLAMPEVKIGFFPDVGATWFLNRMPLGLGVFLGLTGAVIQATDALVAGLADYRIPSDRQDEIYDSLLRAPWGDAPRTNHGVIGRLLHSLSDPTPPAPDSSALLRHWSLLARAGTEPEVEGVLDTLRAAESDDGWLRTAMDSLADGSPSAARVALKQLHRGRHRSLEAVFDSELALAVTMAHGHDFAEGVRALLVDKDRTPAWRPATLTAVDDASLRHYFPD